MAQVIIVKWQERNKEFIAALSHLQSLYDHDDALFQFGNPQADPPSTVPDVKSKLVVGIEDKKKTVQQNALDKIINGDFVNMTLRMPFSAEEFSINLESEFTPVEDLFPAFQKGADIVKLVGKLSGGLNSGFTNLFGLQVWNKTSPIELNLEFSFNTVKNGWLDVWAPMMSLCGQAILSLDVTAKVEDGALQFAEGNTYRTPGVSLPNLGFFQRAKDRNRKSEGDGATKAKTGGAKNNTPQQDIPNPSNTKVVKIEIPGLIFLETALIKSCKPTFSKEITESGAPLWGKLDITIQSVFPAHDNILFKSGFEQIKKLKKKTLGDKLEGFIKNVF